MNCVLVCFRDQSEVFSCVDADSNEPQGSCMSASMEGLSMAGGLLVDPCSVRSDGCGRPDGWPPLRYREACTSAPLCSAAVHFRERLFEQGEMRGSLPINI